MRATSLLVRFTAAFLPSLAAAQTHSQKSIVHEIQTAKVQRPYIKHQAESPFLSATLKTEISPVPSAVNQGQIDSLSRVLVEFLTKVFDEQEVYDIEVVGVAIFEERLASDEKRTKSRNSDRKLTGGGANGGVVDGGSGRRLALNALQAGQFHFDENDPYTRLESDDRWDEEPWDDEVYDAQAEADAEADTEADAEAEVEREEGNADNTEAEVETELEAEMPEGDDGEGGDDSDGSSIESSNTLTFATVVSAEHTQRQSLSHAEFQTMLVHVCHKFRGHMVEYVTGIDDAYFAEVDSVAVSGYEDAEGVATKDGAVVAGSNRGGEEGKSKEFGAASSVVILALAGMFLAVIVTLYKGAQFYRRKKQTEVYDRWRKRETATGNDGPSSLRVLYSKPREDDFSFDPVGTSSGYNGRTSFDRRVDEAADRMGLEIGWSPMERDTGEDYGDDRDDYPRLSESRSAEETKSFGDAPPASAFPTDPSVFPISSMDESTEKKLESLKKSPSPPSKQESSTTRSSGRPQHVFAPPGKVGVAIDVDPEGRPVVHRVKTGSPLEGLLKSGDRVLAIDDVDTTSMSAADVTSLMVRRMNYGRKITFVRAGS